MTQESAEVKEYTITNEEVTFDEKMVLDNIAKHVEDGDLNPLAHGLLRLLAICIEREEDSRIADRARAELARLEEPLRDGRADATRRVKRDLLKCIIREGS